MSPEGFRWIDGERTIAFGRGAVAQASGLIGASYRLLSTERSAASAPALADGAAAVHHVRPGRVDEIAGELLGSVSGDWLVALGGGRVIDTAKALAAAGAVARVAAIPTTLSGAEMTAIHRQAAGAPRGAVGVRPALVVNDPALSASQPVAELAASAGNALGHALEGPLTPLRNPLATLAALEAGRLIAAALGVGARAAGAASDPDRDALALAALLAGYVIGCTGYGLHHVLSQTLVRFAGIEHGVANTIVLRASVPALRERFAEGVARLDDATGGTDALASQLGELAGSTRLRDVLAEERVLDTCAEQAASRPELAMTPPAPSREEILALYRSLW